MEPVVVLLHPDKQKRSANSGAFPESADHFVQTTPKTFLCSSQLSGMLEQYLDRILMIS